MRLIMISDLHLLWDNPVSRLDDLRKTQEQKLLFLLKFASEHDATVLEAGDWFNRPRGWYLLPEIIDILKTYNIRTYAVYGQHDTYMYSEATRGATSLGILEKAGLVKILSAEPEEIWYRDDGVAIYGCSYGQEIPVVKNKNLFNILVIHAPIAEKAIYPGQNYFDALSFLKDHKDFDLIHCGDIHQKFMIEHQCRIILNSGPMLRKEATLYNFSHKPGFFFYDSEKNKKPTWIEIPHQPAELVLSRAHIDYENEATNILDEFIGSIGEVEINEEVSFTDNLLAYIKKNKIKKPVTDIIEEVING
jgi:DNA repair exonuclease SbcCD nuclease subunit